MVQRNVTILLLLLMVLPFTSAIIGGRNTLLLQQVNTTTITTNQSHNDLSGLQGGQAGQYYHFNQSNYQSVLTGIGSWITNTVSSLTNYFTKSDILGFNYYNSTSLNNNNQLSNGNNYWNDTFATFNKTYADTIYVNIDGDTMIGNLNFSKGSIYNISSINYNTSYIATGSEPIGTSYWDTTNGALSTKVSSEVTLQNGQELFFYGKASGNVANGQVCEYAGVQGDHVLFKVGNATEIIASPFLFSGIATETITNGNFGRCTWFGRINGVYTRHWNGASWVEWTTGDALYWDNTNGSQLTNVAPIAPQIRIEVGFVEKAMTGSAENGVIYIAPEYGNKLVNLDDVNGMDPDTTGQFYIWNQSTGVFEISNITNLGNNLYYGINNPYSYYNSTTAPIYVNDTFAGNYSNYLTLFNWNKTYADTLYAPAGSGNASWNQSLADSLYYSITNPYGYYNITTAPIYVNDTFGANYSTYLSLFNWNKTYADTLYFGINNWNATNESYYLVSNPYEYYNITTAPIYVNDTFGANYSDYLNTKNYALNSSLWTSNYSDYLTLFNWNKTYADTLYANTTWAYNQTIPAINTILGFNYYNSTNAPIYLNDTFAGNYSTFLTHITWTNALNGTLLKASEWNATNTSYYLVSNPYSYYNVTTAPIYLNDTFRGTNYSTFLTHITWANAVNGTLMLASNWNATNESYYLVSNPYGYLNQTNANLTYVPYNGAVSSVNLGSNNLTTTGNVGIGTTNPNGKLDVRGNSNGLPATSGTSQNGLSARFGNNITSSVLDIGENTGVSWIQTTNEGNLSLTYPLLLNPNGGNVGIGTTSPGQKLDIAGNIQLSGVEPFIDLYSSYWSGYSYIQNGVTTGGSSSGNYLWFGNPASKGFTFAQGATNPLTIDTSGNVGIGTVSPQGKLEIKQSSSAEIPFIINSYGTAYPSYTQYREGDSAGWEVGMGTVTDNYKYMFSYGTIGTTNAKLTIQTDGNVGIGTTAPDNKLDISAGYLGLDYSYGIQIDNSTGSPKTALYHGSTGTTLRAVQSTGISFENSTGTRLMVMNDSGYVGIGTTTPTQTLDVNGSIITNSNITASLYKSEGYSGINATGTSCTITRITNGIITGATCT